MREMSDIFEWFERIDLESINAGWFALAFALIAIIDSMIAIRYGRIWASFRNRWWWIERVRIERDQHPIQFWARVLIQMLVAYALVVFGVYSLCP